MKVKEKELDDKDKQIVKLAASGYSYEKISKIVFLSKATVKNRIKIMREYYNCTNSVHLVSHLKDNGLI